MKEYEKAAKRLDSIQLVCNSIFCIQDQKILDTLMFLQIGMFYQLCLMHDTFLGVEEVN